MVWEDGVDMSEFEIGVSNGPNACGFGDPQHRAQVLPKGAQRKGGTASLVTGGGDG